MTGEREPGAGTPASHEALLEIVREQPGLTSYAILNSLGDEERERYRSPKSVARALTWHPTEVHRRDGCWFPGPATAEPAAPVGTVPPPSDPIDQLEQLLRKRLAGRRLIAEVGLDAPLFEDLTTAMEQLLRTRTIDYVARNYPFVFMAFLVGHGVYNYEKGNFWGRMPVSGVENSAGPIFAQRLRSSRLEDFDDLVAQDNATKYVAPILAHGGIPKYCLDDFFNVVIKDMQRVGASADELLASWRTRKSAFFQVDKPVGRFLLYGGDLAVDLLDRCLSAIEDIREHGRPPKPGETGLPPYVVVALLGHQEQIRAARPRLRTPQGAVHPTMVLDPYAPFGPELRLPPVQSEMSSTWRVWSTRGVQEVGASTFETASLTVAPARSWTVQLSRHGDTELEWSFEGYDESAALFFDSKAGVHLPPGRSIRANSVWVLSPSAAKFTAVTLAGAAEPRVIEECTDLSGAWSGYAARRIDLTDVVHLVVEHESFQARRSIQLESAQPMLLDEPTGGVLTDSGLPVFAGPPRLQLPTIEGMAPDEWQVRLTEGGRVHRLVPSDDLVVDLVPFDDRVVVPSATLTARGPLGADFSLRFAVTTGLRLTIPERLLFPDERHAPLTIELPGGSIDGGPLGARAELDATSSRTSCRVEGPDGSIGLRVDLPRLVWAPVKAGTGSLDYADRVIGFSTEDVTSGAIDALAIRTGTFDLDLELRLVIEGKTVQISPTARTAGIDGRRTFGLTQFVDTLRQHPGSVAEFVLRAGQRPVTLMRLRPPVRASNITCSGRQVGDDVHLSVTFDSDVQAKHRVARFWPLFRPWDPPASIPIPDGANEVTCVLPATRLPAGRYLLEIEVDDGWTVAARPPGSAASTSVVSVGDLEARWPHPELLPPIEILERALATGHIGRHLDPSELDEITAPAMTATFLYVAQPDPGLPVPRGAAILLRLLALDRNRLARAVNAASARLAMSASAQARLAIELLDRVADLEEPDLDDDAIRMLWATSPVLAARIDLGPEPSPDASSRIEEALAWAPEHGTGALFTGDPVDQTIAGRPLEMLTMIRDAIDLVPKSILDADTLVAANFEWLIAARQGSNVVEQSCNRWSHVPFTIGELSSEMERHLARRQAPRGTEGWASFPKVTLLAALALIGTSDHNARDFLLQAADFAPKLVARDLVLAIVLHEMSGRKDL